MPEIHAAIQRVKRCEWDGVVKAQPEGARKSVFRFCALKHKNGSQRNRNRQKDTDNSQYDRRVLLVVGG
jgi:hypothetical protein